ncbi:14453_t:CDS:1, partial [Racocetra fulgida]
DSVSIQDSNIYEVSSSSIQEVYNSSVYKVYDSSMYKEIIVSDKLYLLKEFGKF